MTEKKTNAVLANEIADKVLYYLKAATSNGFNIQAARIALELSDEYTNKIKIEDVFKSYIVNNSQQQ